MTNPDFINRPIAVRLTARQLADQEREAQKMCRETMPCPECGGEMRANGYRCYHCGYEL